MPFGLLPRTMHQGRTMALIPDHPSFWGKKKGAVNAPNPRRTPAAAHHRSSRVAKGLTVNEWSQRKTAEERQSVNDEGRQFVDELVLPYSRNPTVHAGHALAGKDNKMVRSTEGFDAVGTPRGSPSLVKVLGSNDTLQVESGMRHALVDGTGRKRDLAEVSRLHNPTWEQATVGFSISIPTVEVDSKIPRRHALTSDRRPWIT